MRNDVRAGAPRLPGFHTSVGGGGEKQTPEWYQEKGTQVTSRPTSSSQPSAGHGTADVEVTRKVLVARTRLLTIR